MIDLPTPALIGVIHLPPLAGSPRHTFPISEVVRRAVADGSTLQDAGFHAAIVENFGDAPFVVKPVPPATVAAMAVVADAVRQATKLVLGINVLRNDADAALGIAAATHASFIRVNVHTGVAATDQGWIEGQAHSTLRYRQLLGCRVAILADVHVKHGMPIAQPDIGLAAQDTAYRGLADGLIVTGSATGAAIDLDDLRRTREAVPDRRVFIGSGATAETISGLLSAASGVIVGTGIKVGGDPASPIDADLARAFVEASGVG